MAIAVHKRKLSLNPTTSIMIEDGEQAAFYLHHMIVETSIAANYRIKLSINSSDIHLTRDGQSSVWKPPKSLEVSESCNVRVTLKSGHTVAGLSFRREEITVNINVQEAIREFLRTMRSEISVADNVIFHQEPVNIAVWFRPPPTSETVRSELQNLQEAMSGFRHIMADATQKHLDTAIKYGVAFSELDPRSKAAFSVLAVTFTLLKEQKQRDERVSGLVRQLKRFLPFADEALKEAVEDNIDILRKAIGRVYTLTTDVAEFSYDYVKRKRFKGLVKGIVSNTDQENLDELARSFNELVDDFDRALHVEMLKALRSMEEKMLLDKLEPIQVNYSFNRGCMDGTRVALLDEIFDWALRPISAAQESKPNVYWLYGIPGIGKTAIAHSISARLHKRGRLGGIFFCRRDDPRLSNPISVLSTLIFKLAETWGGYRKMVADKLRKDPHLSRTSAGYELFSQLLDALETHPSYPLVLVIDALDECGDRHGRSSILKSLFDASSCVNWLRVIVTSRHDYDIESAFERFNGHYLAKNIANDDRGHRDIRFFAQRKLAIVAKEHSLPEDWPGDESLEQIVQCSGGLFIFVETLSRLLEKELDPDYYLARALSLEPDSVLKGLYSLYERVIRSQIGSNRKNFLSVMRTIIVVAQYRPLPDEVVAQFTGLRTNIVTTLVNKLGSLLYRDAAENYGIRFRHLSVIDFLTGGSAPKDLSVDSQRANYEVGISCLRIMIQGLRFNICDLESSSQLNADIADLKSRVDENISIGLQYACLYWSNHLVDTPTVADQSILETLDEFTGGLRLLYWIEALSVMSKVSAGDSALRKILLWLKSSQMPFIQRLNDAQRFLLAFREAVVTSAPHIYLSGLPFMPTDTDLWRNASEMFDNLLIVRKGRMKTWPARPHILYGHSDRIESMAWSPDGRHIASGSHDRTIRIWDAQTGTTIGEPLCGHNGYVRSVAYSPDGHHLISGSHDGTIQIWNAETGMAIGEPLRAHADGITCVTYSPDGQFIASSSCDGTIHVWDIETRTTAIQPMQQPDGRIHSISYSPDGQFIVSGSSSGTIWIWDVKTGVPVSEPLRGHTDAVRSVVYSPDGRRIISGSSDKTIQIWDAKTGTAVGQPLKGHTRRIQSVTCSPDGHHLISSSHDGTIRVWDAETGMTIVGPLLGHSSLVESVACSPDGRSIISGSAGGTIRIWDAKTGVPVGKFPTDHTSTIYSLSYSPDGQRIVSGSLDGTICIWEAETGTAIGRFINHTNCVQNIAYTPDGHHIISTFTDGTVQMWNTDTGKAIDGPVKRNTFVTDAVYSPDRQSVIFRSRKTSIQICDANSGEKIGAPLKGHTDKVLCAAFSPDGRYVVSGSKDKTIRIWDVKTGRNVGGALKGHTDWVQSVTFSPDGCRITSGSYDTTIRIWDAEVEASSQKGNPTQIWIVSYLQDGRRVIYDTLEKIPQVSSLSVATGTMYPDSSGWVRDPDGGLLFWVPEDYRNGLTSPAILTIPTTGRHRVVRLDFSNFRFGASWTDIRGPVF